MRILAVDDDPTALEIIEAALVAANYANVATARSGYEALDLVETASAPFDCILLDIMMPGMDGIDLCKRLRAIPEYDSTPIIMITAVDDQEQLVQAIHQGATDYVNKPFDGLELGARLRAATLLRDAYRTGTPPSATPSKRQEVQLDVSDPITLDPIPGATSQMRLIDDLLIHEHALSVTHVFAVTILEINDIFEALPPCEFRCMLNKVASQIAAELGPWGARIAYCGNGHFTVVLSRGGKMSNASLKKILKPSILSIKADALPDYEGRMTLSFAFSNSNEPRSGVAAIKDLSETLRLAQRLILPRRHDANLSELREVLKGREDRQMQGLWFGGRVGGFNGLGKDQIKPRRVRPKGKTDPVEPETARSKESG